jgi:hypothetical protein
MSRRQVPRPVERWYAQQPLRPRRLRLYPNLHNGGGRANAGTRSPRIVRDSTNSRPSYPVLAKGRCLCNISPSSTQSIPPSPQRREGIRRNERKWVQPRRPLYIKVYALSLPLNTPFFRPRLGSVEREVDGTARRENIPTIDRGTNRVFCSRWIERIEAGQQLTSQLQCPCVYDVIICHL